LVVPVHTVAILRNGGPLAAELVVARAVHRVDFFREEAVLL